MMSTLAYKKSQQLQLNSAPDFEDTEFRDVPAFTRCPMCCNSVVTKTWQKKKKPQGCCSCLFHPSLLRIFRDTIHSCPRCSNEIARFNRFGIKFRKQKRKKSISPILKYKALDTTNICAPVAIQMEEKENIVISVEKEVDNDISDDEIKSCRLDVSETAKLLPSETDNLKENKKIKRKSLKGKVSNLKKRNSQSNKKKNQEK